MPGVRPAGRGADPPPTASDNTVTATEDRVHIFAAADFNFADVDTGDALASVTIVTLPALGWLGLANDGTAVMPGQEITSADIDDRRLIFAAAANAHGDSYTSFTFKVSDGTDESVSAYTMTVDVTAVDDAPTASNNTVTTTEDTAYTFAADDFNFADGDTGDALASVKIVTLPASGSLTNDGTAVMENQSILRDDIVNDRLVFTPRASADGDASTSFTFKVSDGAYESVSAYTMTVDVTAANDAPTASDNTVTATEDTAYTFAADDFNFIAADTGDALASVKIVTLPVSGSLTNDGTAVMENQSILRDDIVNDRLVFTPRASADGDASTSFTFKVSDGSDESASAYTMTINVTAVDGAPTASDNTVTTTEDTAYTFAAADFNFAAADTGDPLASVRIVTLPASGSLTNDGTAVMENQSILRDDIVNDRLVFTPRASADGDASTSFTFKVSDGSDESASTYTMTINVTAVDGAPTASDNTVTATEDTAYTFAADDFNFAAADTGDPLASVRIVTLPALGSLANDGTAVMTNQAIARADIDSGKLVFTPRASADGDASTSFTFKVSDGSDESASTYTMTINVTATVETGMVQGWNARFGRIIGGQLVDAVTARFEFGGGSQVTLGGQRIGGFGPGEPEEAAGFADRLGWMKDAENAAGPRATRGMTGKELLRGSAFHLSGGEAGEDGGYVVWGHVAVGAFESRADGLKLDGDVTTSLLGVDGKWGRVLAGFALARSEGEGSFRQVVLQSDRSGRGKIDSSLSGFYPYARLAFGEGLTAWALGGYGAGNLTLTPKDEEAFRTSLAMQIGALGVKGRVLGGEEMGGLSISLKSDAMWVHTASDGAQGLNEAEGDARRLRLMLDAERIFGAGEVGTLTPSAEIGLRHDGGDAETGAGLELGGGFRYALGGFAAEGRARLLVWHDAAGHKEWGASGSLALAPDALARGLSFSFRPGWGQAESGTGALWALDDARDLGTGRAFEAEGRLDGRLGYGFAAIGDRFTATPELRLGLAESHWQYSAGWRLEHARRSRVDFDLLFEATRRGSDDRQPEYGLGVRGSMRW